MPQSRFILFCLFCLLSVLPLQADVISITDPRYDIPNSAAGVKRPVRGMTMAEVTRQHGQPLEKLAPVGTPPITRWRYAQYEVFFEYQTVIHAVVQRPP